MDCRAFHAASCGVFCFFLNKRYQVIKRWNKQKWIHLLPKKNIIFAKSKVGDSTFGHFEKQKCNYKISGLT